MLFESVHPIQSNLLLHGGYTKFLSARDFPVNIVMYSFGAGVSRAFKLLGCQCCVHGECPVPLGFQMGGKFTYKMNLELSETSSRLRSKRLLNLDVLVRDHDWVLFL